jgi:hypothetical protein
MAQDYLLREQFVTDPAQVLAEYVDGGQLPEQRSSVSNQLVYALLSNRRLLRWLSDYAGENRHRTPSRNEFMTAFGHAVVEHGGDHVVLALIRSGIESASPFATIGVEQAMLFTSSPIFASGFLVPTDHRTINAARNTSASPSKRWCSTR